MSTTKTSSSSSRSWTCPSMFTLPNFLCFLISTVSISSIPFLYFYSNNSCTPKPTLHRFFSPSNSSTSNIINSLSPNKYYNSFSGDLRLLPFAWNNLPFRPDSPPPPERLTIALFVKKWPDPHRAGGMERHALTLHLHLAGRGHTTHVFSAFSGPTPPNREKNLVYHFTKPNAAGIVNPRLAWEEFVAVNATTPFDVVHSESVGLPPAYVRGLPNSVVSWHGIAYEAVHSEIAQDVARLPDERRDPAMAKRMSNRMFTVIEEVKFFNNYAHHVATSDHVGDVLRRVYMIPEERVHIILNGVDENIFKKKERKGLEFRKKHGVPETARLVMGMSGRLVRDKGHPIMVEALRQILEESPTVLDAVYLFVAGDGPWAARYKELGKNMLMVGPLDRPELSEFYNSLDLLVHPTLRAQGLDQTVLEAMITGKPVAVARFAGITESAIVSSDMGYVFSPTVAQLKRTLYQVIRDGKSVMEVKGEVARRRASKLFTASKMSAAFERLFLCIAAATQNHHNCQYPLPYDI